MTRPATADDVEAVAEVRAVAMRADLERLGRYDEHRVRQRLRDGFVPAHTRIIELDGALAGFVRPCGRMDDAHWLEHFYLAPHAQGRGIGTAVLREAGRDGRSLGTPTARRRPSGQSGPPSLRTARLHVRTRGRRGRVPGACAPPLTPPSPFPFPYPFPSPVRVVPGGFGVGEAAAAPS